MVQGAASFCARITRIGADFFFCEYLRNLRENSWLNGAIGRGRLWVKSQALPKKAIPKG